MIKIVYFWEKEDGGLMGKFKYKGKQFGIQTDPKSSQPQQEQADKLFDSLMNSALLLNRYGDDVLADDGDIDMSKAMKLSVDTQWKPSYPFEEGIIETAFITIKEAAEKGYEG